MNRNYKVIWNASLNCFMAVSEYAKARGKSSKSSVSSNATINTTSTLSSTRIFRITTIWLGLVTAGFSMQAIAVPCDASTEIKCGINATTGGLHGIAIGKNATVLGSQGISIGGGSSGQNTTANGEQSIAIGANTVSKGASSIAIGGDDLDTASKTNIDGTLSTGAFNSGGVNAAFNDYAGRDLLNTSDNYGGYTEAGGAASIAMGAKSRSAGNLATAIGIHSSAAGTASSVFGVGSSAAAKGSLALGAGAQSIIDDGVALGSRSVANVAGGALGFAPTSASVIDKAAITATNSTSLGAVSLGNAKDGNRQIVNLAAGTTDSDAVNVAQLRGLSNTVVANKTKYYSVNSSAVGNADNLGATKPNAMAMGGNASATGGQAIAIGSGESGQNTTASGEQSIAIGANVESSGHSSIAIGGDDLDDASKTAGVNDTFKYYTGGDLIENSATPYTGHTESVGAASVAIGVKAQSEGDLSTAVGVRSSSSGDASSAFGMGSSASKKGSVALGAGSTTITDATKEEKMTVGGVEYDIAGAAQGVGAQVSVGSERHERQIKHVSGGAVNESSTDAINGSQLYATNIAVDKNSADIALGLDFTGDNSMTTVNRKLGQKLTIQGGETDLDNLASGNNIGVVGNDTNSTLTIKLAKDLTSLDSATFGDVIISNKGINNGFNRITNVAAGIDFTDAATVGQLEATTFALGKGWGISAQGANATKVVGGDSVDLNNTDGNIVLSKTTDSNDVSFDLNPNLSVDSIKAGANTFNDNGLTIVGGPSVTVAGINANNTKITNLMDGDITKDSKDAINGGQLYVIANDLSGSIATNTTNITKNAADIVTNTANISTNTTNIKANKDKIDAGLNFGADSGAVINKPIGDGSVLSFKGGNNIKTTAEGSSIKFDLNGNINVDSVTTGDTTVSTNGVVIVGGPSITKTGIYAGNGETAPSMTAAGINAAGTKVTNVADGMAPRDAVNFGQLDAVSRGLGNSINELGYKIGEVEDDANAGISAAMAMSSLPQAYIIGKPMIGGGIATFNGESAVAIGFSKMSNDGRWVMKLNGTADTQGNVGAAIGAGFHFD
ncbi:YadA-like family protein [Psychrobacter immobilis]|uniref:YadA-like family protein n=1 Tax=Psychrobacter immobilis TaxID=498 RepID=UPI001918A663|nr:YadA-like family protein [Psychrobacter immobilis]